MKKEKAEEKKKEKKRDVSTRETESPRNPHYRRKSFNTIRNPIHPPPFMVAKQGTNKRLFHVETGGWRRHFYPFTPAKGGRRAPWKQPSSSFCPRPTPKLSFHPFGSRWNAIGGRTNAPGGCNKNIRPRFIQPPLASAHTLFPPEEQIFLSIEPQYPRN